MSCNLTAYGIIAVLAFLGFKIYKWIGLRQKLNRWKKTPKDTVILHGFFNSYHVPSTSPFVLKLETYLRMANIPYKRDSKDYLGPKGKMPWISVNGEHIADSQLCIKYLAKKFGKDLNKNYNDQKLAIGTLVRVMLEEHLFWGLLRAIFVDCDSFTSLTKKMKLPLPFWLIWLAGPLLKMKNKSKLAAQGMGVHTKEEVYSFMIQDLQAIGTILGNNKYLLGDEPCEDDAALFGFAAQLVWGLGIDTKEAKFVHAELPNVTAYCHRMKDKFWPDWENSLAK